MRSEFTLREFELFKKAFWLMPTTWSDPGKTLIADLKRAGGAAAVSILPWLGRIAASPQTQPWAIAAEELARVCGVDSKGVRKARKVLEHLGHASAEVKRRHGARLLHWRVKPHLVARNESPYFYFSFRMLYGGHWTEMSAVQRAIYMAAGTLASVFRDEVRNHPLYPVIERNFPLDDIEKSRKFGCEKPNEYRLACASYADLARISGYEISTVKRAVDGLKCPYWKKPSFFYADDLTHSPLWVYPSQRGSALVYHFRDHVRPWPWAVENARVSLKGSALVPDEEADLDLPF